MKKNVGISGGLAYLAALGVVLAFHAYALHLDETSETEPTRITQRQA